MGMWNVMVDLETTGTDPAANAIIQISAVRFDLINKKVDASDMFDRCLAVPMSRSWDQGTIEWWSKHGDVLDSIMARQEPARDVVEAFHAWACKTPGASLWAKPITFEYPFLASYFRQYEKDMPFHYRYARDVNTYLWAKGHEDTSKFWDTIPWDGLDAHNALHDVLHQIRGVFNA